MQTRMILTSMVILFTMMTTKAQEPVYAATINKTGALISPSFQVHVKAETDATIFGLWIQNPEKKKLSLLIRHNVLGIVVDTTVSADLFACRYNMEQVEDGKYTIVVGNGKERVVKELEVQTVISRNVKVNSPQ